MRHSITSSLIAIFAMTFSSAAYAEVKADGSVLNLYCGQVDRTDRPFSVELSPNKVCFAQVIGEKGRYLTVQPNLGATQVYEMNQAAEASEVQLTYVGIIGPQRLLTAREPFGFIFKSALVSNPLGFEANDVNGLKVVLFSQNAEPTVASDFQLIFHTMATKP